MCFVKHELGARSHVSCGRLLERPWMVVANKCDALSTSAGPLVDQLKRQLVEGGQRVVVVPASGKSELGLDELKRAMKRLVPESVLDNY